MTLGGGSDILAVSSGSHGLREAMNVLKNGGSALDAVEAGVRVVEDDPDDHSVGRSGYPNLLGEVELDACIMEGRTLRAGAVAGLTWCPHAISVARKVMEELPHVLLVGEGANRFAREVGFPRAALLTPEMRAAWKERLLGFLSEQEIGMMPESNDLRRVARIASDPQTGRDTVNFIAIDAQGSMASGVSTSGWAWKYPGRAGDTAIVGAGSYVDDRYGAAACTGRGEMAMRVSAARTVVLGMKRGMRVEDACEEVMRDLAGLEDPFLGWVDILAVDRTGRICGSTWREHGDIYYISDSMDSVVAVAKRRLPSPASGTRIA